MISRWINRQSPSNLALMTNSFEFFDLFLFIHFGWLINEIFFIGWPSYTINLFMWGGIYFLAPLCSLVFGYTGDIFGRKFILINSALAMAIISMAITVLPITTFPHASAVILLCIRCLQGILLGAEPMSVDLYMIENEKDVRRGAFYSCCAKTTEGIGSVMALGIGFIVFHFLGKENWRVLFFSLFLFLLFVFYIRKHLNETTDYKKALSDEKIALWDRNKIKEFYRFSVKPIYYRNLIAGFLRWLGYPACFVITYFYISKYVCQIMGWTETDMVLYNLFVILGEHVLSFCIYGGVVFFTAWNIRYVGLICNLVGCSVFFYALLQLENLSIPAIFVSQVIFMALVNYCWLTAEIFKVFSVIGRFTNMASTWALARLINFFICVFGIDYIVKLYGLGYGCFIVLLIINVLSLFAFAIVKPYSSLVQRVN